MATQNKNVTWWKRMVDIVSNRRLRKSEQAWMNETWNPLWNLDGKQAQLIFDYARSGNYAQLQYLYNEIEKRDPTLLTCVTRRSAAISELDWKVVRSDERLNRNVDKILIQEQIECIETAIAKIENLPEAMEHLGLFAFRGYSHVSPIYRYDGTIERLELLDLWNFCFDRRQNKWLWNPDATSFTMPREGSGKLQAIPDDELVTVVGPNAIDWPGLFIFLRMSVGERDWGKFIETYGLPPVIITMPEFTSEQDQQKYMDASEDVFEGKSGVIPYGSQVNYGSESRGTEPFSTFLEHQQKLIVLMATGGTLTSLAESGSGTLGGNAQMDVWKQIVRRDVRRISNSINKQLCEAILKKEFKGKPILAEFQLDTTPKLTADEVLDLAGKASSAGFEMDEKELTQATGFTIRKRKEEGGGFGDDFDGGGTKSVVAAPSSADDGDDVATLGDLPPPKADVANAQDESIALNLEKTHDKGVAEEKQINHIAETSNTDTAVKSRSNAMESLARSLQEDFKGVADEIVKILALPENERTAAVQRLMLNLESLVPDDPVMAEVIFEQMQSAFGTQIEKHPDGAEPAANRTVPNSDEACDRDDKGSPCPRTDCPENASGRNDGKILFHADAAKSKELADEQSRGLGYKSVDDMMAQSTSVGKERVEAILSGNETRCKPHEAVAAIRSGMTIPSGMQGEQPVKMTEFTLRHYVCGERRKDNTPKLEQLATLPLAVRAIRFPDSVRHTLKGSNVIPEADGSYPKGTQTEYRKQFRRSARMVVSAYTDKGILSGWREV